MSNFEEDVYICKEEQTLRPAHTIRTEEEKTMPIFSSE